MTNKRRYSKAKIGLGQQTEDLFDYRELLEARARNKGKRTFTTEEVRKQLGLA